MVTNRQKANQPVLKGTPKTRDTVADAANQREVERSIDEWRAMQGLPPLDRSKEARHG